MKMNYKDSLAANLASKMGGLGQKSLGAVKTVGRKTTKTLVGRRK